MHPRRSLRAAKTWCVERIAVALGRLGAGPTPMLRGTPLVDRWSAGGIGPQTARLLASLVESRRPERILECGPGTSTIVLARAAQALRLPTRIVSLEHDAAWAERARIRFRRAGILDRVEILVAPLAPWSDARIPESAGLSWYSCAEDALARGPYDMLVLDGPPARDGRARRMPALPILWPVLRDDGVVVLDDARRPGEEQSVQAWRTLYGEQVHVRLEDVEKGVWVVTRRPEVLAEHKPAPRAIAPAARA